MIKQISYDIRCFVLHNFGKDLYNNETLLLNIINGSS